jgi:phosphoribosylamine--glycine ligase
MRILVLGSGGREHALAWSLAQSPEVTELVIAPGNPGTEALGRNVALDITDAAAVSALADDIDADLVVVGPEAPLVAGVADALHARGRLVFGPTAAGARLEGSKAWMKSVLARAGVPTARYAEFASGDEAAALAYLDTMRDTFVIKTDGLAAGKGVLVTTDRDEARDAVRSYLSGRAFGVAGQRLIIEEGLTGPEVSLLVLCDGNGGAMPLSLAQDHKRIGDGDTGANTGGMGAYSPVPFVAADVVDEVMAKAIAPTLAALAADGIAYCGVLFAGLMLTPDGPKVLEYNVRFGDPETQVVLPRLRSDLATHLREAAEGRLRTPMQFTEDAAITVVLAAPGYPADVRVGDLISGIDAANAMPGVTVFHAGTRATPQGIVSAGGRVLNVTAVGATLSEARDRAYAAITHIAWPGMQYRTDIGRQGTQGPS